MIQGSTASDGTAKRGQKKESAGKYVTHGDCTGKQSRGRVTARGLPLSPVSPSSVVHAAHQRRWSVDFSKSGSPHVIIVRKNKKEPQPPQRSPPLIKPHPASGPLPKRYSCPSLGLLSSRSSSSSSTTSSCSSPPPLQTSVITGPDPLGWKLRPKSSSAATQARTNRLSLQIPLPVVFPDHKPRPVLNSQPENSLNQDPSLKVKPPPRVKPLRRHHSDSSALLISPVAPLPVVTLEVKQSNEPDDVFSESEAPPQRKIPPPVPEKTIMARKIAQLIAYSLQPRAAATTKTTEEDMCSRPKPKQALKADLKAPKSGLHLGTSSTARFPGREI